MTKLPSIPPSFLLQIMLNSNVMFCTSFSSLEDLVKDDVWQNGCDRLHASLKEWIEKEGSKVDEGS